MNQETATVEINGIELEEGDTLWRLAGLRTWETTLTEQEPDEVLSETAQQLAENYPEAVDGASAGEVKNNLRESPGYYDDTDLMQYHSMKVDKVDTQFKTEITLIDWKEEQRFAFTEGRDEVDPGGYIVLEPLETLEKHLGVTLLPTTEDDNGDS